MPLPILHPAQQQALEALEWLYSQRPEARRSGRSTVLALHYLRRLCRGDTDQSGYVYVDDHYDTQAADQHLIQHICGMASEFGLQVNHSGSNRIRLDYKNRRENIRLLLDMTPCETEERLTRLAKDMMHRSRVEAGIPPGPRQPLTAWERLLEDEDD